MPKLSQELMERLFFHDEVKDESVLVGPQFGEDAAVISDGDRYWVIHPDPISGAKENIGWLSINVPANDIAVTGARPRWALPSIQVPEGLSEKVLEDIVDDIKEAASSLGISLVGGHTETVPDLERPLITTTLIGTTESPILTKDSQPGDLIIQVDQAGVEGCWILASDHGDVLEREGMDPETVERTKKWRDDISVVDEALDMKGKATSMHDPTEGGVLQGIYEMAKCSDNRFVIDSEPMVRDETKEICDMMGLDPLKLISSGCLLTTVREDLGVGKVIGRVEEGDGEAVYERKKIEPIIEDELFKAIKKYE